MASLFRKRRAPEPHTDKLAEDKDRIARATDDAISSSGELRERLLYNGFSMTLYVVAGGKKPKGRGQVS